MITYRVSTQPEPPVRFYKVIALSFLAITIALLGVIIFITSKKATVVVVAKTDIKPIVLTLKVASGGEARDAIKGGVSSTAFSWSETFYPTGTKSQVGTAKGQVILYNKTNAAQTLIKTTRLLDPTGKLFRLADKVVVPANGKVTAAVYADKSGAEHEIGPTQFIIPGLSVDKQKVIYAVSEAAMKGGEERIGVLSAEDVAAAEKQFKDRAAQAFAAQFPVRSGEAQTISIIESAGKSNHQIGDEVADFKVSGTSTVVVVTYAAADLNRLLEQKVGEAISPAREKVVSVPKTPQITVAAYDSKQGTAELAVRQEVTVTLDADVESLAPQNFLGKKKAEIERYVLGLDHVSNVDVKFSPRWMLSAPMVPDKVKVIVKTI